MSEYGYECPVFITAGLEYLANEIERVEWNKTQKEFIAPTDRHGDTEYKTKAFIMRPYNWDGDDEGANFECDGFEVRWYKYLGRGMEMNREIDANEFFRIIDMCLGSLINTKILNGGEHK